jgi:hypothetical protein
MAADLCSILLPVDFSNQCVLAARHVKTEKLSAALKTLHVNEMFSIILHPTRRSRYVAASAPARLSIVPIVVEPSTRAARVACCELRLSICNRSFSKEPKGRRNLCACEV